MIGNRSEKPSATASSRTQPTNYWFQWVGTYCSEVVDTEDDFLGGSVGHIEFDSDRRLFTFSGEMELLHLEKGQCQFTGRKVSNDPGDRDCDWGNYLEPY